MPVDETSLERSTASQAENEDTTAPVKRRKKAAGSQATDATDADLEAVARSLCVKVIRASMERTLYGNFERTLGSEAYVEWLAGISRKGRALYMPSFFRGADGGGEELATSIPNLMSKLLGAPAACAKFSLVAVTVLGQLKRSEFQRIDFLTDAYVLDIERVVEQVVAAKAMASEAFSR